eukprot:CAMPEP_0197851626 /NCGR_PEP_ID=MMETSP1438-20131217/18476_1 /TAXON_ID=1461541 /ORGANISM="Pterosperma sp., Strain CCMP1384" /LENGTH=824 /DNA_ID=CAMNT_0043465293 /DNA_START=243 /DNA_END=2717 /DNA_ORIENTATION=+
MSGKPSIDVSNLIMETEKSSSRPTTPSLQVNIPPASGDADNTTPKSSSTPKHSGGPDQVTIGVLNKWVNGIKGYHERLFVLDHAKGVLSYYKVHGPDKYNVCTEVDRPGAKVVGEHAMKYAAKARKDESGYKKGIPAQGEVALRVASHRESSADHKKFYVHSGTKTLQLRAESREDRWQWLEALQSCKTTISAVGSLIPETPTIDSMERIPDASPTPELSTPGYLLETVESVEKMLQAKNLPTEVITDVIEALHDLHTKTVNYVGIERGKRRMLLDYIRSLEDDKRVLEAEVVVEQRRRNSSLAVECPSFNRQILTDSPSVSKPEPAVENFDMNSSEEDPDEAEDADEVNFGKGDCLGESDDEEFFDAVDGVLLRAGSTNSIEITPERAARLSFSGADELPKFSPNFSPSRSPTEKKPVAKIGEPGISTAPGDLDMLPIPTRRQKLPIPKEKEKTVSLWSIIKEMVGKDLTRVCLPVFFNEPISALQKVAEELEYCQLLDIAATHPKGSIQRVVNVAGYAVGSYCSTEGRTKKPFNPLQHETYELICPEQGFRFMAEKVCHHPTILAMHAEGRGWTLAGDCNLKSKFWGRCIEISPVGVQQVTFHDGEIITWQKVSTTINNLIIGNMYVDHYGTMKIRSSDGPVAKLKFKEQNFMERQPHQVKGDIMDKSGTKVATMQGKWDLAMTCTMLADNKTTGVWERSQFPEDGTSSKYHLTSWAITLNEMLGGMEEEIPMTDSRRRPDQRLLELGQYSDANAEKQRLEEKQRAARKKTESGEKAEPRWFKRRPETKDSAGNDQILYDYVGGYWEARESRNWTAVKDIFS